MRLIQTNKLMQVYKLGYLAFLTIHMISCRGGNGKPVASVDSDSLIKRVYIMPPKLTYIGTDSQAIYFENEVGLDPIRRGYDSLEIRISYNYGTPGSGDDSTLTLVIKNKEGKWASEILKFDPDYHLQDSVFYSVISRRRGMVPATGWGNFIDTLFSFGLLNKPYEEIEEGKNIVHGPNSIQIEVATKSKYIQYSYFVPSVYQNEYWQIEDLKGIIELLKKELNFNL